MAFVAMKRSRRSLAVNWKAIEGAAHGKRKLILRANDRNMFTCPIKLCLHADFKSNRGLRKHINNKHPWYYYFDEQPEVKREEMEEIDLIPKKKANTTSKPSFSLEEGIGKEFLKWLCTSCGGGKTEKEAKQSGKRAMKFFMQALGNNNDEISLTFEFVDCCLSNASIIISFLTVLEEEWKLSSSGSLNYIKAISDFVDFRKAHGVSDNTLRCFAVVEVYLRRAMVNLRKKKNLECNRNLDLETLIARDSWATIEEMEEIIPFHMKSFKAAIEKCKGEECTAPTRNELVFCVRFITTMLFLRVKCSRPMTFQFITLPMIKKAKINGGFIEQTEFKTSSTYIFDTLILSEDVLEMLDLYMTYVRPRLEPKCDYLLLSTNGTQFKSLTTAMTMLVHQAIGKYIHPTRYRQIVETESSERLTPEEQNYISEDQKHSSRVAKIFYKKKQSRKVAIEGKKCMEKMVQRQESNKDLMNMFQSVEDDFDPTVLQKSLNIISEGEPINYIDKSPENINLEEPTCSKNTTDDPFQPLNESIDMMITDTVMGDEILESTNQSDRIPNDDIVIKKEIATIETKKVGKNVKFTKEEDKHLKKGIQKYGRASWSQILKDKSFNFHSSRNRDSLRSRANSAAFKKLFVKDK